MKLYLTRLNIGFWLANIVISSVDWAALNPSISTVKDWSYYLIYIGLHIRWTHACPPKPEPFASWFSSIHIYVYIHIPNLFIYLLISYTNIDTNVYIYQSKCQEYFHISDLHLTKNTCQLHRSPWVAGDPPRGHGPHTGWVHRPYGARHEHLAGLHRGAVLRAHGVAHRQRGSWAVKRRGMGWGNSTIKKTLDHD